MDARKTPLLTPARVVALVLVALVALGLAYLRFAPGDGAVSVPSGAKAGDLMLEPCEYATESGSYAADCGTLVVPENRADPQSRLIALPVTRIRAQSANPAEPIFRLEGGPGITNMEFSKASRFTENRDVVLVGYRGVDGSVRLDCPEVESALDHSTDVLGDKSFRAYADGFSSCADRHTDDGVDLAGYSLPQQADDLEAARVALGYDRVDLLSESAGTRLALIYGWRHPESVHRSVLIGVNPPGHFLWDEQTTDEQIARYAELCAEDESCSRRAGDLAASLRRTAADLPERWWFLPIEGANVHVASLYGLFESTQEDGSPVSAPTIFDSWLSAADGDASGLWFASLAGDLIFPRMFVWGEYAAVGIADAQAAKKYFASRGGEHDSHLARAATAFVWGGGRLADAWPAAPDADDYSRVRRSNVETLLVGGALDVSTPPQVATRELLPHLPNGRQVVLPGIGHSASFWSEQPEAGTRLVNAFFDTGRVDDSFYRSQSVDFTPTIGHGSIAKIVLGVMLGWAALTVLSLLWMARRVHERGRFGRKAGATIRTLSPIVLGLGGWLISVLVVLTATPGVPLDDELLVALSVGLPVGLGSYWGWVDRDRPADTRRVGLAAAVGGALVGAWLGFNASSDVLAVITATAGAAAGANLLLVALDVAEARSARDRLPASAAAPAAASPGA